MVGEVKNSVGLVFEKENFLVIKKVGEKGNKIEKHNHPQENVLFTVVKGKVEVLLNEEENHVLSPGDILTFDGNNFIQAEFLEEGQVFVTLIKK